MREHLMFFSLFGIIYVVMLLLFPAIVSFSAGLPYFTSMWEISKILWIPFAITGAAYIYGAVMSHIFDKE